MITYHCPHCNERQELADELAGRSHVCGLCGKSTRVPGEPPAMMARAAAIIGRPPRPPARGRKTLVWALLVGITLATFGLGLAIASRGAHERAEEAARREALRDLPAPVVNVAAVDRRHGIWGTWVAADVALQSRCEHVITVGYRVDGNARGARALGSEVKTSILQPGERKVESLEFDYDPSVAPVDQVAAVLLWWNGPAANHQAGAAEQSKAVPVPVEVAAPSPPAAPAAPLPPAPSDAERQTGMNNLRMVMPSPSEIRRRGDSYTVIHTAPYLMGPQEGRELAMNLTSSGLGCVPKGSSVRVEIRSPAGQVLGHYWDVR